MKKPWFVYILRCRDGSLYTGSTTDLKRRLFEHRSGRGAAYTRGRGPLNLVWSRRAPDRSRAQKLEARIKTLTRGQKLRFLRFRRRGLATPYTRL